MCIRDRCDMNRDIFDGNRKQCNGSVDASPNNADITKEQIPPSRVVLSGALAVGCSPVSYTHLRAQETVLDLVCRLLPEKKKLTHYKITNYIKYII